MQFGLLSNELVGCVVGLMIEELNMAMSKISSFLLEIFVTHWTYVPLDTHFGPLVQMSVKFTIIVTIITCMVFGVLFIF